MPPSPTNNPDTTPVVVACCRTAIGRAHADRGVFRRVRGDELAAAVVQAVVARSGVEPDTIEDIVLGATQQRGELGGNVSRCVALLAGLPFSVAGAAITRDQARFGFDIDHKLSADTLLNVSMHFTGIGEAPDVSGAISIRRAF